MTPRVPKVAECRVPLTMSSEELDALDRYCSEKRRQTGELVRRAAVIREAVQEWIRKETGH